MSYFYENLTFLNLTDRLQSQLRYIKFCSIIERHYNQKINKNIDFQLFFLLIINNGHSFISGNFMNKT